jgi:hypothetical protein
LWIGRDLTPSSRTPEPATVRSPAEKLWLECGLLDDIMPTTQRERERERERYSLAKHFILLSIL